VAVAQPTKLREEVAKNGALLTILSILLLIPKSLIAIFLLVKQSIKPITELAEVNIHQKVDRLMPLSVHELPIEISPFIMGALKFEVQHFSKENDAWEITNN